MAQPFCEILMNTLGFILLSILHIAYAITRAFQALVKNLNLRRQPARGVHLPRDKVPAHIALVLAHGDAQKRHGQLSVDDVKAMLESVLRVAEWSQAVKVSKLTVYDREGVLVSKAGYLRRKLLPTQEPETDNQTLKPIVLNYPLTPPLSDVSTEATETESDVGDSMDFGSTQFTVPASSEKAQPLCINVISDKDGRTEVALCARQLAAFQKTQNKQLDPATLFKLDINTLDAVLEGEPISTNAGVPLIFDVFQAKLQSPDMLLVHSMAPGLFKRPLELHAFPPWQIRLTEMQRFLPFGKTYTIVEEAAFAQALDIYSDAEFRLGK
ncbi:PaRep2b domain-containing protein [Rhizoctonia solani AG-1 IA]|uniref:ditrans,polycis-polyprenyl diphosphate synthase [(2E,6E)-farnesyldiphosphate specific] n=1 Tax=Thanatephorus cucumeris (strain AG1-IA) TaxID=983506 RepID=L8WV09_THACA|nr:PaRep2b domain-containing protein [Rhizoctonia solani AG-1 IA]